MSRIYEALQNANPAVDSAIGGRDAMTDAQSPLLAELAGEYLPLEDVPRFVVPKDPASRLVAWAQPNCIAAENLRALSARLRQTQQRRSLKKILVTGAAQGEGKSSSSANLAITLANYGERTLLIDGDLHQPSLSATLQVENARGFATWHEQPEAITNLLYRAEDLPLWFLPAGLSQQQPIKLIQSAKTAEMLRQLATWFSWIVIDSPPLVPLADAGIWATLSDATVLVVRQGFTPKHALLKALESLDRSKLLALILNDANGREQRYYQAYYRSGKGAHEARS